MPGKSKKGGGLEVESYAYGAPYKMKGNPFQRNFGIGSPMKDRGHEPEKPEGHKHTGAKDDEAAMTGVQADDGHHIVDSKGNWRKMTKDEKKKRDYREEASPMEFNWKEVLKNRKEVLKKGWDKATQIGMGLKEGVREYFEDVPVGSRISDYPGQRTVEAAKYAYKKEKAHDEAGGGAGTYAAEKKHNLEKKKKREAKVQKISRMKKHKREGKVPVPRR